MLHASAVVVDGWSYLFSGPCAVGKSTHTGLWLRQFGTRAFILNDDKPALRMENGRWYAYGTPWSGKHDLSNNLRVPIAGLCFLRQGQENAITPFGGAKAIYALLEQTVRPPEAQLRERLLTLMDRLLTDVPFWQMECNMETSAAQMSFDIMSAGRGGKG